VKQFLLDGELLSKLPRHERRRQQVHRPPEENLPEVGRGQRVVDVGCGGRLEVLRTTGRIRSS
jgi:hypothetical protein